MEPLRGRERGGFSGDGGGVGVRSRVFGSLEGGTGTAGVWEGVPSSSTSATKFGSRGWFSGAPEDGESRKGKRTRWSLRGYRTS